MVSLRIQISNQLVRLVTTTTMMMINVIGWVILITTVTVTTNALEYTDETRIVNWMSQLRPAIDSMTIMDMVLPGTHNSGSYNLSVRFG